MAEFESNLNFAAKGEKFRQGEVVIIEDDDLERWHKYVTPRSEGGLEYLRLRPKAPQFPRPVTPAATASGIQTIDTSKATSSSTGGGGDEAEHAGDDDTEPGDEHVDAEAESPDADGPED